MHLEIDYKKPVPAASMLCLTAELTSVEGRKAWVTAKVQVR